MTSDQLRFWEKVAVAALDECWTWTAHIGATGYGQFRIGGRARSTHRVVAEWALGPPPPGAPWVLHACDNRPCCNPLHLRYGTPTDNVRDMVARDRLVSRWRLTAEQERRLVADRESLTTEAAVAAAAVSLGVSRRTVYRVLSAGWQPVGTRPED